ncbi:hypothetical protein Tco_0792419 [Tanacetum coccineum]
MSAKNILRIQTCTLTKDELSQFITAYSIPSEYKVLLPKSNQTIYDAPDEFVGLYTHSFTLANLKLLLLKFLCDVLEYFYVHVSRLNPFGYAKLTTFLVMCKAYDDSIVPSDYPELLSKDNRWDKKTFKDKLPPSIHENPFYQRLGRHHVNIRTFSDSILFLAGLKRSWEHGQQWPVIFVGRKDFRNFMYTEDDEDLSFLLREPSLGFRTGSLSTLTNNEPLLLEAEPLNATNPEQLFENTVDSRGSLVREGMLVIGTGSVVGRMKDRKVRLKGSTKPTMKRNLVQAGSSSRYACQRSSLKKVKSSLFLTIYDYEEGLSDVPEQQNGTSCHLMISNITPPAWRGHFDNQIKGECDMLKEMKKARDKECEELKAKCEAAMANFDNNPVVNVLRQKIKSLSG